MPNQEYRSGLYTGPTLLQTVDRGLRQIEVGSEQRIHFDQLLTEVLLSRSSTDTSPFLFFDFGSGLGGSMVSFLYGQDELPHFYQAVAERGLTTQAVGLTDAPKTDQASPSKHNTLDLHFKDARVDPADTARCENVFYTITAVQTLEQFFRLRKIEHPDFILASQSLMYLSARQFTRTVDTMITHLKPGGKIVIWGIGSYGGPLPAFTGATASGLLQANLDDARLAELNQCLSSKIYQEVGVWAAKPDWEERKSRLEHIQALLERQGLLTDTPEAMQELAAQEFRERLSRVLGNSPAIKDIRAHLDQAVYAYALYTSIHQSLLKIKQKAYERTVVPKINYLQRLNENPQLDIAIFEETVAEAEFRQEQWLGSSAADLQAVPEVVILTKQT